ncbi:MAG: carboxypeptidase regulatory-like domain-containing protein, partial [Pirellulales bacterium]|nr:carboxypeptidase regulatory-like domain-containing protein [Pirellulales bacterium]
ETVGPFVGTVFDTAGKPVAGTKIWLLRGDYLEGFHAVVETTADEKGKFRLEAIQRGGPSRHPDEIQMIARDPSGRIGGQVHHSRPTSKSPSNPFAGIRIILQEVKEYRGRLVDAAGHPIPNATIRPNLWMGEHEEEGQHIQELIFFSDGLSRELAAKTDTDGYYQLRGVPANGRLDVRIETQDFGRPGARFMLKRPMTVALARPGNVRGSVTCEQDPGAVAGIKIRMHSAPERGEQADWLVYSLAKGVTGKDGSFRFTGVSPGTCTFEPMFPDTFHYYVENPRPTKVKTGETTRVSLTLKPTVKLQGKVVEEKTGKGIKNVHVYIYFQDEKGSGGRTSQATTDAQGAFTLHVRPGKAQLNTWHHAGPNVQSPWESSRIAIDVEKDVTLPPIRLKKLKSLEGLVVDKLGKPVAGAKIFGTSLNMGDSFYPGRDIISDKDGKFTLMGVGPNSRLSIRARTKNAVAEPVNVNVKESKAPIRLVVDEKTSCTVQGTVVDEAGQPVANADVTLIISLWFGHFGTSSPCDSCKTDASGRFEIGGLWAGDKYDVRVAAKGFEKRGTREIKGKAGGVLDFGKIVLASTSGVVQGKVLDSSGKPLAGARVFNVGDGAEPLETVSDTAGAFRLTGFRKGTVYVFAEKDGYRFAGARTFSGATDAVVTMPRNEESMPKRPAPAAANDAEAKLKATRKLLTLLSAATDKNVKQQALRQLAALDAKQAPKDGKAQATKKPSRPRKKSLFEVAKEDVDEALSLVSRNPNQAYRQLKDLARRFTRSDREKALRFTSEAIVRARSMDDPDRVSALAELGVLASQLGEKEAGEKLAREATGMAAKWKLTERREWQMADVAKTVAKIDPSLALELAEKIEKKSRGSCLAGIVVKLDDLEKAESVLKDIDGWQAGDARGRLAYRIAATRPAEAIRLVENMPSDYGREDFTKAAAFGWLATAIAPKDPKLAHSLIDRAFAIHLHPSDSSQYMAGERAAQPALLAIQADMAGYPDMQSVIHRALASRPTMKNAWNPVAVKDSYIAMALFFALVDRPVAKEMLQAVEPESDAIGSGCCGIGIRDWLKAWALVDPSHAAELIERRLAAAKDRNEKQSTWYAAQEVLELWGLDRKQAVKRLMRDYNNVFSPYER